MPTGNTVSQHFRALLVSPVIRWLSYCSDVPDRELPSPSLAGMPRSMSYRLLSFSLLWVFLLGVSLELAPAEEERSFEDRLLRPDRNQQSSLEGKQFQGNSSFQGQEFRAGAAGDWTNRRVQTTQVEPRRFLGIPIPFTQDRRVSTSTNAMADRTFVTHAANLGKEARDADKQFRDSQEIFERTGVASTLDGRQARVEGTNQHNLQQQGDKMTVEELRTILNKQTPQLSTTDGPTNPTVP